MNAADIGSLHIRHGMAVGNVHMAVAGHWSAAAHSHTALATVQCFELQLSCSLGQSTVHVAWLMLSHQRLSTVWPSAVAAKVNQTDVAQRAWELELPPLAGRVIFIVACSRQLSHSGCVVQSQT